MRFDAVGIEYAFAKLLGNPIGERGTQYDAHIFRDGDPKRLSEALDLAVEIIYQRTRVIQFNEEELTSNEIGGQLNDSLARLHEIMLDMKRLKNDEARDYHWNIIGSLLQIIHSLLTIIERDQK